MATIDLSAGGAAEIVFGGFGLGSEYAGLIIGGLLASLIVLVGFVVGVRQVMNRRR